MGRHSNSQSGQTAVLFTLSLTAVFGMVGLVTDIGYAYYRKETAQAVIEKKKNDRWFQEHGCSHEHSKQAGGGTHCVHVHDNDHPGSAGYIICQLCQGRVRPDDPKWRKLDPDAIFDTALFNKLFQDCAQIQGEMLG